MLLCIHTDKSMLWYGMLAWYIVAVIFQGIRTCIARKPYIFVIFQGADPPPPPLDPHMAKRLSADDTSRVVVVEKYIFQEY